MKMTVFNFCQKFKLFLLSDFYVKNGFLNFSPIYTITITSTQLYLGFQIKYQKYSRFKYTTNYKYNFNLVIERRYHMRRTANRKAIHNFSFLRVGPYRRGIFLFVYYKFYNKQTNKIFF